MSLLDLFKATIVCGAVAFVVYSFPIVAQSMIIGIAGFAWLTYARKVIRTLAGK